MFPLKKIMSKSCSVIVQALIMMFAFFVGAASES